MADHLDDATRASALQFMTTEHFTLQTARSATIADASSRASLFISTVSSALVALAFIGQISGIGAAFYAFSFVLLPALCFLGIVTFIRTLELAIEDMIYARGIGRIRRFYLELAPQTRDYFILAANDDTAGAMGNMGLLPSRFQLFVTTAGMVSVITSILAGVLVGLAIQGIAAPPLPFTLACGSGMFLVAVAVHTRVQLARWERAERQQVVLFPSAGTER